MGRVITNPRPLEWRCYICSLDLMDQFGRTPVFERRGERHTVCSDCIRRYASAVWQAETFGRRYRFVERREMPKYSQVDRRELPPSKQLGLPSLKTQIFLLLILALERRTTVEGSAAPQEEVFEMVTDITRNVSKFINRVATIVGKTYAVRGDDLELEDSEALVRIRDLLLEIDEKIIDRNKKKRLP